MSDAWFDRCLDTGDEVSAHVWRDVAGLPVRSNIRGAYGVGYGMSFGDGRGSGFDEDHGAEVYGAFGRGNGSGGGYDWVFGGSGYGSVNGNGMTRHHRPLYMLPLVCPEARQCSQAG